MKTTNFVLGCVVLGSLGVCLASCGGLQVVKPDQEKNKGTKMVDWSGGVPKVVSTYTCTIVASDGKRVSALGKSEADARQEALAKCRDETAVSFCFEKNLSCYKN